MSEVDHERLLLALLRKRWGDAERLAARGEVDPERFVTLCVECDVPTWVHGLLETESRSGLVGQEAFRRLAELRAKIQRDNLLLIAEAERALGLLVSAGVVPVALKGLDLLYRIYERFDTRTLDDVDLLIRPDQLTTALDVLQDGGFRVPPEPSRTNYIRSSHHIPLLSSSPVPVGFEIHWNLAQEMRFRVDAEELARRAVPLDVGGHQVLRLEDHDLIAHLLLHHFTHYFDRRLKWAVDLQIITGQPGFDWDRVVERVRSWDAGVVSGMSLRHLKKIFPEWIPDSVVEQLPVGRLRRALVLPLRSRNPLEVFRHTRLRVVQLYLATVFMERPGLLPRWIAHRTVRNRRPSAHPLEGAKTAADSTNTTSGASNPAPD